MKSSEKAILFAKEKCLCGRFDWKIFDNFKTFTPPTHFENLIRYEGQFCQPRDENKIEYRESGRNKGVLKLCQYQVWVRDTK